MSTPRRNDPCHCGSGEKYKRCHGGSKAWTRPYTIDDLTASMNLLMDAAVDAHYAEDFQDALNTLANDSGEGDFDAFRSPPLADIALNFFALDHDLGDGERLIDDVLASEDLSLTPGEQAALEALKQSFLAVYEVVSVDPTRGLTLRDVRGNSELDMPLDDSTGIQAKDLFIARLLKDSPAAWRAVGSSLLLPDIPAAEIAAHLDEVSRAERTANPDRPELDEVGFYKYASPDIILFWRESQEAAEQADAEQADAEGAPKAD